MDLQPSATVQASRARNIEVSQRLVGVFMIASNALSVLHWIEDSVELPWQKTVSNVVTYGSISFLLIVVIPNKRKTQYFPQLQNYVPITSSLATLAYMGGTVFPLLVSSYITPEWQTTAKAAGWVVSGLIGYRLYSLR